MEVSLHLLSVTAENRPPQRHSERDTHHPGRRLTAAVLFAALTLVTSAAAETPNDDGLPDAPVPQSSSSTSAAAVAAQSSAPATSSNGQTHRILGIIPNFRAATTNDKLPPQTVKDKFVTASEDSFDYSAIVLPAAVAAYSYGRNKYPEFGTGGVGYGRYLWHSVVDQTVENYMVEFFVPAATHEDTRFYTMGHGGFVKRAGYAVSRVVVTRTDSGGRSFNYGEVIGAGAAAGISNLYYPSRERSVSNTGEQWGLDVGIDAATFVFKEFWPDISYHLLHQGQRPGTTP